MANLEKIVDDLCSLSVIESAIFAAARAEGRVVGENWGGLTAAPKFVKEPI